MIARFGRVPANSSLGPHESHTLVQDLLLAPVTLFPDLDHNGA